MSNHKNLHLDAATDDSADRIISKGNFLTLKVTKDGYEYAERKGKDSIAFIFQIRSSTELPNWQTKYILRNEYNDPLREYILGAFGGSLDHVAPLEEIVRVEAMEEAGFDVKLEDIEFCGKYRVSTQMNQFCHLYKIHVDVWQFKGLNKEMMDQGESKSGSIIIPKCDYHLVDCWKAWILMNTL